MTYRVLAADKLAPEGLEWVRQQGDTVLDEKTGLSPEELADIIGQYDAIALRSGVKITREVLANSGNLKVIARAGVGVDNIDLEAATEKGILVVNTAAASTVSTAEHAFTLMASMLRCVGHAHSVMSEGGWDRNKFSGRQMHGLTLGIVGLGRIGQTVARRALSFGMNVIGYDPLFPHQTALDDKVRVVREFADMLPECDVLSFHVPLTDGTRSMLNTTTFAKCRQGVYVVNAARGGIVDENALLAALESGQCAGAALDVYATEPLATDSPLRGHPQVLTTPHLGASTREAQTAVAVEALRACVKYLRGQAVEGVVNAPGLKVDLTPVQTAYTDLVSRASCLIDPMVTGGIAKLKLCVRGAELAAIAGNLERTALATLLKSRMDEPINIINVLSVAESRGIQCEINIQDGEVPTEIRIEVYGPGEQGSAETRCVAGRVYEDLRPRVVEINRYRMDMVPEGSMLLLQNRDIPGMIGRVGMELAQANININDMSLSRRAQQDGETTSLMILALDHSPEDSILESLRETCGVLKVATVNLPKL